MFYKVLRMRIPHARFIYKRTAFFDILSRSDERLRFGGMSDLRSIAIPYNALQYIAIHN